MNSIIVIEVLLFVVVDGTFFIHVDGRHPSREAMRNHYHPPSNHYDVQQDYPIEGQRRSNPHPEQEQEAMIDDMNQLPRSSRPKILNKAEVREAVHKHYQVPAGRRRSLLPAPQRREEEQPATTGSKVVLKQMEDGGKKMVVKKKPSNDTSPAASKAQDGPPPAAAPVARKDQVTVKTQTTRKDQVSVPAKATRKDVVVPPTKAALKGSVGAPPTQAARKGQVVLPKPTARNGQIGGLLPAPRQNQGFQAPNPWQNCIPQNSGNVRIVGQIDDPSIDALRAQMEAIIQMSGLHQ